MKEFPYLRVQRWMKTEGTTLIKTLIDLEVSPKLFADTFTSNPRNGRKMVMMIMSDIHLIYRLVKKHSSTEQFYLAVYQEMSDDVVENISDFILSYC